MKYHIVGSSGYIAGKLLQHFDKTYDVYRYSPDRLEDEIFLDLTKRDEVIFENINAGDYVIFLAAISSPDVCDKNYDLAFSINVTGTKWFISECVKRKANVLFFSSDVVNGATQTPVDENSPANPFGKYAAMKFAIEEEFKNEKHVKVFRLSYVFSNQDKFMSYLAGCITKDETAQVFDALKRNVIYIEDIIEGILKLGVTFDSWSNSIFNMSGSQLLSRLDLARLYKENINQSLKIEVAQPPQGFFDARPHTIASDSLYIEKLLGRKSTLIEEAMKREFLRNER